MDRMRMARLTLVQRIRTLASGLLDLYLVHLGELLTGKPLLLLGADDLQTLAHHPVSAIRKGVPAVLRRFWRVLAFVAENADAILILRELVQVLPHLAQSVVVRVVVKLLVSVVRSVLVLVGNV